MPLKATTMVVGPKAIRHLVSCFCSHSSSWSTRPYKSFASSKLKLVRSACQTHKTKAVHAKRKLSKFEQDLLKHANTGEFALLIRDKRRMCEDMHHSLRFSACQMPEEKGVL